MATVEDTPKKKYGSYRSGVKDELIFAQDKVRYVGDEVAAVAAIDEETAQEALSLIRVEYEELPAVFHPEEAMKPGAPRIHDEAENNIVSHAVTLRGDIEKGFQEADLILEDRFETGLQVHAYLEPVGCIAAWDSDGQINHLGPLAESFLVPLHLLRGPGCSHGETSGRPDFHRRGLRGKTGTEAVPGCRHSGQEGQEAGKDRKPPG